MVHCPDHQDKGNKSRRLQRLAKLQEGVSEDAPTTGSVERASDLAFVATEPLRMAIGLSACADPAQAAALTGIEVRDPAHLAALVAEARARHADLIARRPSATGQLAWVALQLMLASLIARAPRLAPGQAASSAKAIAQVLTEVGGGVSPSFTKLVIEVAGVKLGDDERLARVEAEDAAIGK